MLPSLKVKIGADTSELDRKLGDTQARLRRFAKIGAAAQRQLQWQQLLCSCAQQPRLTRKPSSLNLSGPP
jgi:hypothetical protein